MRDWNKRYGQIFRYVVVGVMTTIINFAVYAFGTRVIGFGITFSNLCGWFLSVLFAYFANKYFVFQSCNTYWLQEILRFYTSRLFTGVLDVVLMYLCVNLIAVNDLYIKIIVNIVVVLLNYVFGKMIFLRKDG